MAGRGRVHGPAASRPARPVGHGLRWLRRRGSGILLGFPGDAAVVADAVGAHLGG
ncbi:MAG: hypothetical protein ACJ77H_17765 [Actinomycetota bacterium]